MYFFIRIFPEGSSPSCPTESVGLSFFGFYSLLFFYIFFGDNREEGVFSSVLFSFILNTDYLFAGEPWLVEAGDIGDKIDC